jgi:hypothetical protein
MQRRICLFLQASAIQCFDRFLWQSASWEKFFKKMAETRGGTAQ